MKFNGRDISDLEARYHRDAGHDGLEDDAPSPKAKGKPPASPAAPPVPPTATVPPPAAAAAPPAAPKAS